MLAWQVAGWKEREEAVKVGLASDSGTGLDLGRGDYRKRSRFLWVWAMNVYGCGTEASG